MKRLVIIMVIAGLALSACTQVRSPINPTLIHASTVTSGPTPKIRDLSTPSKRLVGHWKANEPSEAGHYFDYFYGEVDPETGMGKGTTYNISKDLVFFNTYEVISEAPYGEELTIKVTMLDSHRTSYSQSFVIAKDGLTAQSTKTVRDDFTLTYIDNKTEYIPENGILRTPTTAPTPTPRNLPTPKPAPDVRDLSSPLTSLIGHWRFLDNGVVEHYYGETNSETGVGSLIIVSTLNPANPLINRHTYTVVEVNYVENTLTVIMDDLIDESYKINIDRDGLVMRDSDLGWDMIYIDNKTQP